LASRHLQLHITDDFLRHMYPSFKVSGRALRPPTGLIFVFYYRLLPQSGRRKGPILL
jgi:hypothetical protein